MGNLGKEKGVDKVLLNIARFDGIIAQMRILSTLFKSLGFQESSSPGGFF
jgi:hypothetical protein